MPSTKYDDPDIQDFPVIRKIHVDIYHKFKEIGKLYGLDNPETLTFVMNCFDVAKAFTFLFKKNVRTLPKTDIQDLLTKIGEDGKAVIDRITGEHLK